MVFLVLAVSISGHDRGADAHSDAHFFRWFSQFAPNRINRSEPKVCWFRCALRSRGPRMVVAGVSGSGVTSGLAAAGCVIGGGAAAGPLVLALGPAAVSIAAIAKEELRQLLAAARDRADDAEIRTRLYRFYSWCADTKIPEVVRLATTIETWWPAILAFLHTGLTNGRTEGFIIWSLESGVADVAGAVR